MIQMSFLHSSCSMSWYSDGQNSTACALWAYISQLESCQHLVKIFGSCLHVKRVCHLNLDFCQRVWLGIFYFVCKLLLWYAQKHHLIKESVFVVIKYFHLIRSSIGQTCIFYLCRELHFYVHLIFFYFLKDRLCFVKHEFSLGSWCRCLFCSSIYPHERYLHDMSNMRKIIRGKKMQFHV